LCSLYGRATTGGLTAWLASSEGNWPMTWNGQKTISICIYSHGIKIKKPLFGCRCRLDAIFRRDQRYHLTLDHRPTSYLGITRLHDIQLLFQLKTFTV
jgi:hypothetical protein